MRVSLIGSNSAGAPRPAIDAIAGGRRERWISRRCRGSAARLLRRQVGRVAALVVADADRRAEPADVPRHLLVLLRDRLAPGGGVAVATARLEVRLVVR